MMFAQIQVKTLLPTVSHAKDLCAKRVNKVMEPVKTIEFASFALLVPYKTPLALPAVATATHSGLIEIIHLVTVTVKHIRPLAVLRPAETQLELGAETRTPSWIIRVLGRRCFVMLVMVECAGIATITLLARTMRSSSYAHVLQ